MKKLILVDVDGVVADLHTEWLRRYNRDYNDTLTYEQITAWNIHQFTKPECGVRVYDYLADADLYNNVPVIKDAVWGTGALRRMGHSVVYVTAYFNVRRVRWLHKHGFLLPNNSQWALAEDVIMANNKDYVLGDMLIDDKPENLKNRPFGVLFEQPWNISWTGQAERVKNWEEIVQLIVDKFGGYC